MYSKVIYRAVQILFDNKTGSYINKMKTMVGLLKKITDTEGMDMIIHTLISIVLALLVIKVFVIYMDLKSLDMISIDAFIQKTYMYLILAVVVILTPNLIDISLDFNYMFFDYISSNTEDIVKDMQGDSRIFYSFNKESVSTSLDGYEEDFNEYYTGDILGFKFDALPNNDAFWLAICSIIIILVDIIASIICLIFVFIPLVELIIRLVMFPISVLTGNSYFISIKKILSVGVQMSIMVLLISMSSAITSVIINNLVDIKNGKEQIEYYESKIQDINSRYDELIEEGIEWTDDLEDADKDIFGILMESDLGNESLEDLKDERIKYYKKQIKFIRNNMTTTEEDEVTHVKTTVSYLNTSKIITFETINDAFTFNNFLFIILAKIVIISCITKAKSYTKEIFIQG